MGKWELTMDPVQEWGEELEDGAVYGVTLRREPVAPDPTSGGGFVQYRTCKVRRLKAATLELLVSHLLDGSCQEQDFSRMVLSTYRTFTSPAELIRLLFLRLDCSALPAFIHTWLDEYGEDLRDPPVHPALRLLLDHLTTSSSVRSQPSFRSLAARAEQLLRGFQAEGEAEGLPRGGSADVEAREEPSDVMDFSAVAVAEQLTRTDAALFAKVLPHQSLGGVWSQRDRKENSAPTIRATVAQFNAVANLVMASLLCQPSDPPSSPASSRCPPSAPAHRARIIEQWIRVAQECRRLRNFSSLRAILSALQANAVYRLRRTWAAVGRDCMATFDSLWETFPDENGVLTHRELLQEDGGQAAEDGISPKTSRRCPLPRQTSSSGGVVPYLGTYLTALAMLDAALPDAAEGGLINFEKRRREFEVLSQIRVLQASCCRYSLPHHPRIAAWLRGHEPLTDRQSFELSKRLEPPEDSCSPPAWKRRSLTQKLSSLLSPSDGSKKVPADQISVSSCGSSGSEMEDLSRPNSACSVRVQSFHSSCTNVSEAPSSSSSSSASPRPCDSSCECRVDLCSLATSSGGAPPPKPPAASHHRRSVSMTALPVYNRQVADSCIVRVSVDLNQNSGNMYKSIMLTSQDKTEQVIRRVLEKHHLEHLSCEEFTLTQVLSQDRELLIPEKANVFYAMSTAANFDFVLRHFPKGQKKQLRATSSLGR